MGLHGYNLLRLGKSPIGIHFSQKPINEQYYNKRAEMAFSLVEWIKRGGVIPDIPELIQSLTQTSYTFKNNQILIEPKEDVKEKLGFSPDHMDALMLTFALPVEKENSSVFPVKSQNNNIYEYDPFSRDRIRI